MLQEELGELLKLAPRVKKLALDLDGPHYQVAFGALAALRELRELRVYGPSREGNKPGRQAFEAAAEELRALRPDVALEAR